MKTFTLNQITEQAEENDYQIVDTSTKPADGQPVLFATLEVITTFGEDTETLWEFEMSDEDKREQTPGVFHSLDYNPTYTLVGDYSDEFHVNPKCNPFSPKITKEQAQARLADLIKRCESTLKELAVITPYTRDLEHIAELLTVSPRFKKAFDKLVRTTEKLQQETRTLREIGAEAKEAK